MPRFFPSLAGGALFLTTVLGGSLRAHAQALPDIPNPGFETWTTRTGSGPGGNVTFQAPQGWEPGFLAAILLAFTGQPPRFDRSSVAHSGTGSLHITVGADSTGSDVLTTFPVNRAPLGLTAWVRNSTVLADSNQTGFAVVLFTRSRPGGGDPDTVAVGGGTINAPTANAWHQVVFPIIPLQATNPDSATMFVGLYNGLPNYQVWVDDLAFVNSFPTGTASVALATAPLTLSPNPAPASGPTFLTVAARVAGRAVVTVTDATGRTAGRVRLHTLTVGANTLPVPTTGLPAGTYVVTVLSAEGTRTTRLVID